MVAGWPHRAGRASFGAYDMRDERPTANPLEEFNAAEANLLFWQLGAMGIIAPKFALLCDPVAAASARVLYGAFAWDQTLITAPSPLPSYLAFVANGVGDYTLTFDATVPGRPDEDGVQQAEALNFQFAYAEVNLTATLGTHAEARVTQAGSDFDVLTFDVGVGAADHNFLLAGF